MKLRLSEMVTKNVTIHLRAEKEILNICPKCGELIFSEWKATIEEGFEGFLDVIDLDKVAITVIGEYYNPSPGDKWIIDADIELE